MASLVPFCGSLHRGPKQLRYASTFSTDKKHSRCRQLRELGGASQTEVAGRTFDWEENDIFVVPNFLWRRHVNKSAKDAVLYTMTDVPLLSKIGQYRAQGRGRDGKVEQLVV